MTLIWTKCMRTLYLFVFEFALGRVRVSFPRCSLQWKRPARTCRLLGPFECASLGALLKCTATITQACVRSQALRSGTVAFNHCVASSNSRTYFVSVKEITVEFVLWENTTRKELHLIELTSKVTTEFAYNGTSRAAHLDN